jgi:hypothetical protein
MFATIRDIRAVWLLIGGVVVLGGSVLHRSERFVLHTVGGRAPGDYSRSGRECSVPTSSEYLLSDVRWVLRDSVPLSAPCRAQIAEAEWEVVRVDSGYTRRSGDTLQFFVDDPRIGVNGLVNVGLRRGNQLIFRADEFDPGDYVYTLVR